MVQMETRSLVSEIKRTKFKRRSINTLLACCHRPISNELGDASFSANDDGNECGMSAEVTQHLSPITLSPTRANAKQSEFDSDLIRI